MVIIYNLVLIIISILLLPFILLAFIIQPKFRAGFWEKLGFYSFDKKGKKTTVFHAVSVGEVNAVKELIKEYKIRHPEEIIIVPPQQKQGRNWQKRPSIKLRIK